MSVDTDIRIEASRYLGWLYGLPAAVAIANPYVFAPVARLPVGSTVCSVFAGAVVIGAFPMGRWTSQSWAGLQIMDATRPWSPIAAVVEAAVGREIQAPQIGRWHYCQGWHDLDVVGRIVPASSGVRPSGGHSWLCYGDDLILQASSTEGRVTWTRRTFAEQAKRYGSGVRVAVLG